MCLLSDTKSSSFSKKIEPNHDDSDLSSILKNELENLLEELGPDEKVAVLKEKITAALANLSGTVDGIKNYRETLDSFASNLEKIIKDWDSTEDDVTLEQIEN